MRHDESPHDGVIFAVDIPLKLLYGLGCLAIGLGVGAVSLGQVEANNDSVPVLDVSQMVIPYEGELLVGGQKLAGNRNVTFELFDDQNVSQWSETQDVMFVDGKFSVNLGSINSLTSVILDAERVFLEITIEELDSGGAPVLVKLGGRQEIKPTPFAAWTAYSADFQVKGNLTVAGALQSDAASNTLSTTTITGSDNDGADAALQVFNAGDTTNRLMMDGNEIDSTGWINFQNHTFNPLMVHGDLRLVDSAGFGNAFDDVTTVRGKEYVVNDEATNDIEAALEVISADNQKLVMSGNVIRSLYDLPLYLNNNNQDAEIVIGNDMRGNRIVADYTGIPATGGDGGAYIANTPFGLLIRGNDLSGDHRIEFYDDVYTNGSLTTNGAAVMKSASVTGNVSVGGAINYSPTCPGSPEANVWHSSSRSRLCVYDYTPDGNWNAASDGCWNTYGAELCTYNQVRFAATQGSMSINVNYWLRDRVGDSTPLFTNGSNVNDFEGQDWYFAGYSGAYCCLTLSGR